MSDKHKEELFTAYIDFCQQFGSSVQLVRKVSMHPTQYLCILIEGHVVPMLGTKACAFLCYCEIPVVCDGSERTVSLRKTFSLQSLVGCGR